MAAKGGVELHDQLKTKIFLVQFVGPHIEGQSFKDSNHYLAHLSGKTGIVLPVDFLHLIEGGNCGSRSNESPHCVSE